MCDGSADATPCIRLYVFQCTARCARRAPPAIHFVSQPGKLQSGCASHRTSCRFTPVPTRLRRADSDSLMLISVHDSSLLRLL